MDVYGALPLDNYFAALTALVTFGFQLSFFAVAGGLKFDKVTDFAYGTNFILLAIMTLCVRGSYNPRQIGVSICIILWGLRLALYLLTRILKIGEDHRFDDIRKNIYKFAGFWFAQFVSVWLIFIPNAFINAVPYQPDLNWRDYLGFAMFALGLIIETFADQQKFSHRNNPKNKGHWCDDGLWNYSRHPNYFGEMLCWWGLYTCGSSVYMMMPALWGGVVGPIYLTFILLFLSGIPGLEKSADAKYWAREDYQLYKKSVSPLIPLPHTIYRNLHNVFKAFFCCEFPLYTYPQEAKPKTDKPDEQPVV